MKIPILILALAASCMAQDDRSIVRFENGDQLTGQVKSLSKKTLTWESMILKEPAEFDLKHVVDLSMPADTAKRDGFAAGHVATLEMTNGDSIKGQLIGLTDEVVRLNTWYAGEMTFRRVNVNQILITEAADFFYRGPNSMEEWTADGREVSWSFKGGSIFRVQLEESPATSIFQRNASSHLMPHGETRSVRESFSTPMISKALTPITATKWYSKATPCM